jgi:multiple sugar transport system substrate-binding protein
MRKKLASLLVIFGMVLLTACNTSSTAEKSGGSSADGKVTVTWWNAIDDNAESKALEDVIKKYEEENPNINIEQSYVPFADIKNKLLTSSVASELPDIVWVDNPDHQAFAAAGIFQDISKEIKEWDASEQYFEGPWSSTVYDGKNYGVPASSNNLALFYNAEMLKSAGIEPPKTWDELKEAAKKLTKPNVYGLSVAAKQDETATFQFLPWLWQTGSDLTDFNSEGTKEALTLWKELIEGGYMSKEVITLSQGDMNLQFVNQKTAMMVNGTWNLSSELQDVDFEWGVVPLPANKESATILGGFNWAITSTSKHKKEAWEFIKFANEPENLKEALKTAGRLPSRKDLIKDPYWQEGNMKQFSDSMENAKARAYGPNYPKISGAVSQMIQQVLTGTKSPEDAIKEANGEIEPLLP